MRKVTYLVRGLIFVNLFVGFAACSMHVRSLGSKVRTPTPSPVRPDNVNTFSIAEQKQQRDNSQLRFGMEYEIEHKTTLPAAIWKDIVNEEENDSTRESILSRNYAELWVDSSVIDLDHDGLNDYVVVAKAGNWLGANATTFWVFLNEGDLYCNVLKTSALQIEFSNETKNGFRTIATAVLSAKSFNETQYAYDGKVYRPVSFKHGSLK